MAGVEYAHISRNRAKENSQNQYVIY